MWPVQAQAVSEVLAHNLGLETRVLSIVPLFSEQLLKSDRGFRIDLASAISLLYQSFVI